MDERARDKKLTPLSLTTEFPHPWPEVKVKYDLPGGNESTERLPTNQCESVEHLLYCLTEYNNKATERGWNGQARFNKWRDTLRGIACTRWDASVQLVRTTFRWRRSIWRFDE